MFKYSLNDIVTIFDESSIEIAEFISKLNDWKNKFDMISNQTMDNADPFCDAQTCLEQLGVLLSTIIIYKNEYLSELKKELEAKKDSKKIDESINNK